MKTLSIKNPWSYLITHGIKDVENRSWKTNYRGRILIHCPKSQVNILKYLDYSLINKIPNNLIEDIKNNNLHTSAIIGEVDIVDCVQNYNSIWAEKDQWHWVLKNPILYKEPILNVKGKLSLWDYNI